MDARIRVGRSLLACAVVLVGVLALGAGGASAAGPREVIYNNIVSPLPGNYASTAFAATSTSEYGGEVEFAGAARSHPIVTVAMSAWACEQGNWYAHTCSTPKPKKKFKYPLTLNVYNVGPGDTVGSKIASVTHTFAMPYRPSQSAECATLGDPGTWFDEATVATAPVEKCFHGLAFTVSFHLGKTALPGKAIISLSYNTTSYGPEPKKTQPCDSEAQGCYYDSLNFADVEPAQSALSVGSDPTESQFVNSNWSEMYCGKTESLDTFAPSGVCPTWWEGDQPVISVQAN
ncbi:MAG: hypothetical protein ACLQBB_13105 [Solirubrobacteraceae bacterium]